MTAQIWVIIGAVVAWETIELRRRKSVETPPTPGRHERHGVTTLLALLAVLRQPWTVRPQLTRWRGHGREAAHGIGPREQFAVLGNP